MSDPHDREPVDQAAIDCWRVNYGLDKRTPAQAAQWWSDNMRGFAPSGCVAALGVALDELSALRKDAERYRWLRAQCDSVTNLVQYLRGNSHNSIACRAAKDMDDAIDGAMAAAPAVGAA